MAKNYYLILGVQPDADEEEIKRAYKRRALEVHPDCGCPSPEKFLEIQEAYEHLRDAVRRRRHDELLARRSPGRPPSARPTPRKEANARTLHVHLDPAEASAGCRLSVPISLPVPCPACRGWGMVHLDVCAQCLGHGALVATRDIELTIPPGVHNGTRVRLALDGGDSGQMDLEVLVTTGDDR
jgi:curved DNA-binding protein